MCVAYSWSRITIFILYEKAKKERVWMEEPLKKSICFYFAAYFWIWQDIHTLEVIWRKCFKSNIAPYITPHLYMTTDQLPAGTMKLDVMIASGGWCRMIILNFKGCNITTLFTLSSSWWWKHQNNKEFRESMGDLPWSYFFIHNVFAVVVIITALTLM